MTSNLPIVEFLSLPENLPLVVDVVENFSALYDALEKRFVDSLWRLVQAKYAASSLSRDWILRPAWVDPGKITGNRHAGAYLTPVVPAKIYPFPGIYITRESGNYYLYYGIEWDGESDSEPKNFPGEKSRTLTDFLSANEFDRNRWTLGWKNYRTFTGLKQFLTTIGTPAEFEILAAGAVDDFWAFFEDTSAMVGDLNRYLFNQPST
jgi:hypothetical protein